MSDLELPAGRYVFVLLEVWAGSGGLLRAVLLRDRLFREHGGVAPSLVALRPYPDYVERRRALVEEGILDPATPVVPVFDHLRLAPSATPAAGAAALPGMPGVASEEAYTDGSPFRTAYRTPGGDELGFDYRRPDGTVYLRTVTGPAGRTADGGARARLVAPDGRVTRRFRSLPAFYRAVLGDLLPPPERTFVFVDNRITLPLVVPLPGSHVHLIYTLHNLHTTRSRRWDSPMSPTYARALGYLSRLDAQVTLTARQRDDIRLRFGPVNHIFPVANPVMLPAAPEPRPARDDRRLAVVSRMAPQKNLGDALRAFRLVLDAVPDARLDVYGDGRERPQLERLLRELRLEGAATLHGFQRDAKTTLWTASAFLLTNRFEGYPLATLESLAHGCPVIAYDIKYGPREQITDGVDGYVVPRGDVEALAARAVTLLRDPALRDRMSAAALAKAADHGPARFLQEWRAALEGVVALAPRRTELTAVDLEVARLTVPSRPGAGPGEPVVLEATVVVAARPTQARLEDAVVQLTALGDRGEHTALPLEVDLLDGRFRLRLATDTSRLFEGLSRRTRRVQLRLQLSWENSSWQVLLADGARWSRPQRARPSAPTAERGVRRAGAVAGGLVRRVRRRLRRVPLLRALLRRR